MSQEFKLPQGCVAVKESEFAMILVNYAGLAVERTPALARQFDARRAYNHYLQQIRRDSAQLLAGRSGQWLGGQEGRIAVDDVARGSDRLIQIGPLDV